MGLLDPHWSEWFSDLKLTHIGKNETLLAGFLPDQATLHSLLERVRDLNLTLISVCCAISPTQSSDEKWKGKGKEQGNEE